MNRVSALLCAAAFCSSPFVSAADLTTLTPPPASSPEATPWAASASLGYLAVRGNTRTTSLNFKGALGRHVGRWGNILKGQANYAKDSNSTSAQSWELGDTLRYNLTEKNYLFGAVSYTRDRFAAFPSRASQAVGYGRQILDTPTQMLTLAAGPGVSEQRAFDSRKWETRFMAVFDGNYVWKISDSTQFSQLVHVEWTSLNTYVNPVTELKFTIVGNLFATLDYEVRYNTHAPAGTLHTDTLTTVNLGYGFGKF
ncbi:MAG: DUF481 domain-containing protein [Nevskiaceae bacterium]|nr:MAG: DUF481 domain-containing protein [Nevskiaceae bacterium]TBR75300.1 MAG: DUF481 domain-containing protein [Nevskiaceae bacterium]